MSTCTTIESNPDVSGIGIRVNLYFSILLVAIIPETVHTMPLIGVLVQNAGISGFALLITAMVQTAKHSLSLYHAIFIVHILSFTGIVVAPAGNYKGNIRIHILRAIVSLLLMYGSVLLFMGYAFYIWANASTFGQNSECNDQIKYIFVFVSVRATVGWLRKLWMALLGIGLVMLVCIPLAMSLCFVTLKSLGKLQRSSNVGVSHHQRTGRDIGSRIAVPLGAIYGVVTLELYEKRNQHLLSPGENDFTFGQIMALVQIISALNEVFHFILGLCTPEQDEEDNNEDESIGANPQQPNSTLLIMKVLPKSFRRKKNMADRNDSSGIQNVATTGTDSNEPINSV